MNIGIPKLLVDRIANPLPRSMQGVPVLMRAFEYPSLDQIGVMRRDHPTVQRTGDSLQWGIFRAGTDKLAIEADTIISVEHRKDFHVAEYPQEPNSFQSYNKIERPFESRVRLARGGSRGEGGVIGRFLDELERIAASLELFDVVTPERAFFGANITHFDYARTVQSGSAMIVAEVWLQEIRQASAPQYGKRPRTDAAQATTYVGNVTPRQAKPSVKSLEAQRLESATQSMIFNLPGKK